MYYNEEWWNNLIQTWLFNSKRKIKSSQSSGEAKQELRRTMQEADHNKEPWNRTLDHNQDDAMAPPPKIRQGTRPTRRQCSSISMPHLLRGGKGRWLEKRKELEEEQRLMEVCRYFKSVLPTIHRPATTSDAASFSLCASLLPSMLLVEGRLGAQERGGDDSASSVVGLYCTCLLELEHDGRSLWLCIYGVCVYMDTIMHGLLKLYICK